MLVSLATLLSAFAIWLHFPGHVSNDSSMQLYEASLGRSLHNSKTGAAPFFRDLAIAKSEEQLLSPPKELRDSSPKDSPSRPPPPPQGLG